MRLKYIVLVLIGCLNFSCDSIDDRLEENDELRLIALEALEEPYANPGDKYTYKLMAQSLSGWERVVISEVSHELDSVPELPSILLVDSISIDKDGYLSRPVKTAIIQYPIIVPKLPGETISVGFTVTDVKGKSESVRCSMLVANYKEGKQKFFYNTYRNRNYAFYSTRKDACYGWLVTAATYYKKNVADIDFYAYADAVGGYHVYSPDCPEVPGRVAEQGNNDYNVSEMRKTRMVKLEGVDYKKAKDKEILAIDFTQAVDKIKVEKGDNIGFLLADGRKGIMNIVGMDAKYLDFKCKTQTIPQ